MEQLSLWELNNRIKDCLKNNLEDSFWVVSEIGEMRFNQKGHCYLELVEKKEDEILAKNKATIWSYNYRNLSGWFESLTGQTLKPGLKILSNVVVSYHEVYGLSLNIKDIDASYTLGERAKKRLEILNRLKEDGISEMNKDLPLPLVPQRIAIIASFTSAGYLDFIKQLENNTAGYAFRISHFQAIMQGSEAEDSIIKAILEVNTKIDEYDLLVIIRGGGATLDLECFDTYGLVSHIAQFPIPVITGIGHERDETIADIVANTSLKTPTAVAEFLISGIKDFDETIDSLYAEIFEYVKYTLRENRTHLEYLSKHIKYISENTLKSHSAKLSVMTSGIQSAAKGRKKVLETLVQNYIQSIKLNTNRYLDIKNKDLKNISDSIELLDPKRVLNRGYSIVRKGNKIIKSVRDLKKGDLIKNEFKDGVKSSKILN
jgi:exodeoxyribonuclease VII large subunit